MTKEEALFLLNDFVEKTVEHFERYPENRTADFSKTFGPYDTVYNKVLDAMITKEKREKPEDAEFYGWDKFELRADEEGYGEYTEDWQAWWECWKAGYICATNS